MPDNAAMTTKTLLVDGSSYPGRAYHALPDLQPGRLSTGAIHGMVAMLKCCALQTQPEHAACVFDAKGDTFRDDWYPVLQGIAQPRRCRRPGAQIAPIHEAVRLLGWPVLMVPGIEADDAIGTLARIAAAASGHEVAHLHRRQGSGAARRRATSR